MTDITLIHDGDHLVWWSPALRTEVWSMRADLLRDDIDTWLHHLRDKRWWTTELEREVREKLR